MSFYRKDILAAISEKFASSGDDADFLREDASLNDVVEFISYFG